MLVMGCSCLGDESVTDKVSEITMYVSAQTDIMYDLFDDERQHPIECMLVKGDFDKVSWQKLYFGEIEGFTYERGHEYELRVRRTILANPPQDGSDRRYELVRIVSDTTVSQQN